MGDPSVPGVCCIRLSGLLYSAQVLHGCTIFHYLWFVLCRRSVCIGQLSSIFAGYHMVEQIGVAQKCYMTCTWLLGHSVSSPWPWIPWYHCSVGNVENGHVCEVSSLRKGCKLNRVEIVSHNGFQCVLISKRAWHCHLLNEGCYFIEDRGYGEATEVFEEVVMHHQVHCQFG